MPDKNKGNDNVITLEVVVGGTPVKVSANVEAPLQSIIGKALADSGNVGQNPNDWELVDKAGKPYNLNQKSGDAGLKDGSAVYLNRKAGGGG
jgi:hypothetical protein